MKEVVDGARVRGANRINPTVDNSSRSTAVAQDALLWDGKDE